MSDIHLMSPRGMQILLDMGVFTMSLATLTFLNLHFAEVFYFVRERAFQHVLLGHVLFIYVPGVPVKL